MEAYIDVFFVVRNVCISFSWHGSTRFLCGERLSSTTSRYGNTKCVFHGSLVARSVQLVGNARIPAEDIGKEALFHIHLGEHRSDNLLSHSEGLEKGSSAVFWISVCAVPPYRRCIPNCLRHKGWSGSQVSWLSSR